MAIFRGGVVAGERKIRADREGKGGGNQAGLPSPIPGTDHDSDGEDEEAAFNDIVEQQGGNEGEGGAEHRYSVTQDGCPSGRDIACAKKGEVQSHTK